MGVGTEVSKVQHNIKIRSRGVDDPLNFMSSLSIPVYDTRERSPTYVVDNHVPLAVLSTGINNLFINVRLSFKPGRSMEIEGSFVRWV